MSNTEVNWQTLVERVAANDQQAAGDWIEICQNPLMSFCFYLCGNKALAEDICHDAFVKGLQSIGQLRKPEQSIAWLKQIARRLFLDYKKSAAQSKPHMDFNEMNHNSLQSESLSDQQILAMQALQILSEEERNIVIMVDIQGHSYLEVAELIQMKEGTVKSKLFRARKKMLESIETFQGTRSSNNSKVEGV